MSDIKFACPHCQQHIQCEPGYAGMQINCPACGGNMLVPGQAPVRAAAPAATARPAPVATPPVPALAHAAGNVCPGCANPLPRGAVVCTKCGFNLATGRPAGTQTVGARGKAAKSDSWVGNPNIWLGIVILIFAGLFLFGRSSDTGMIVYLLCAALYVIAVNIWVLIAAFKDSVGTGFLTLCIPVYGVYFVFSKSENPMLKTLYTAALALGLSLRFLKRGE